MSGTINKQGEALASLLPVTVREIGTDAINAVDGRALHAFLEVGTPFHIWMPRAVEDFGFLERHDFEVLNNSGQNPQGGRPSKDYILSIPMAKELAMVQRTAKGKEARLYFIECERRASQQVVAFDPSKLSRLDILTMAVEAERKVQALECKVQDMEPKAEFFDAVQESRDCLSVRGFAKLVGTGEKRLFSKLRAEHILDDRNVPYQQYLDHGYFRVRENAIYTGHGTRLIPQSVITAKGQAYLVKRLGLAASA